MTHTTRWLSLIAIAIGTAVLGTACAGGGAEDLRTPEGDTRATTTADPTGSPARTIPPSETAQAESQAPQWAWDGTQWVNRGGPAPECPDTLVPPVDISLATSVLYPGQFRPDYKAHGGFRFDGLAPDEIPVVSPIDGMVVRGAHYLVSGELQYTLDLIHPCGLAIRLGHVRELTLEWTAIFDGFAPPVELDSRTTWFSPAYPVEAGEQIALSVGLYTTGNVFLDFGVYDLRERNAASASAEWLAEHDNETDAYGVCWFNMLGEDIESTILALPAADQMMGKTSDYCTTE